jgi:hypothetical protein
MDKLLTRILSTRRSHNSQGELQFVAWLHEELKSYKAKVVTMAEGCVTVEVGSKSKMLFSCHVDTMHGMQESHDKPTQDLYYDPALGQIFLASKDASCLGADDGAGIYIMLSMIKAKVKGTYIFHRGEERGCIGSRAMVARHPEWLKKFDACIAFDRPNGHEVIVTQSGQGCASIEHGTALAKALNDLVPAFSYEVSHKGVVTDSKMYAGLIPECINIGVGYCNQHSKDETQDWEHLEQLTKAAIALDWDKLPIKRIIPVAQPPMQQQRSFHPHAPSHGQGAVRSLWPDEPAKVAPSKPVEPILTLDDEMENMNYSELVDFIGDADVARCIIKLRMKLAAAEARSEFLQSVFELDMQ